MDMSFLKSSNLYLGMSVTGVTGMVASSFLFADGVRQAYWGIKNKDKKVFWKGVLKTLPMVASAGMTMVSIVTMNRIQNHSLLRAVDAIGRVSTAGAPIAQVATDIAAEGIDAATDSLSNAKDKEKAASEEPKPQVADADVVDFIDPLTGQRFKSSVLALREASVAFNETLQDGAWHPVNDFFYLTKVIDECELGDLLGFQVGTDVPCLKISFSSTVIDNHPVMRIAYRVSPKPERAHSEW